MEAVTGVPFTDGDLWATCKSGKYLCNLIDKVTPPPCPHLLASFATSPESYASHPPLTSHNHMPPLPPLQNHILPLQNTLPAPPPPCPPLTSQNHCFTVYLSLFYSVYLSLFHCLSLTVSLSISHCFTVNLSLFYYLSLTVLLSISHCFTVYLPLRRLIRSSQELCACLESTSPTSTCHSSAWRTSGSSQRAVSSWASGDSLPASCLSRLPFSHYASP